MNISWREFYLKQKRQSAIDEAVRLVWDSGRDMQHELFMMSLCNGKFYVGWGLRRIREEFKRIMK